MNEHDPFTWKDAALWLWGLVVTILAGSASRVNSRIAKVEESVNAKAATTSVDQRFRDEKADYDRESVRLERMMTEHRQETRENFKSINDRLDTIIERMMQ